MLPPAFLLQPVVTLVAEIQLQNRTRLLHNFKLTPKTKKNSRKTETKRSELKAIGANWTSLYQSGGRQATKCEIQISSRKKLTQDLMVGYSVKMYAGKERETRRRLFFAAEWEDGATREQEQRQFLLLHLLLPPLPSQRPSVRRRSNCGSADEKQNTRKEGKLPMDKKNEVHIPDPKTGPHTRSGTRSPHIRGPESRYERTSTYWVSNLRECFFNKNINTYFFNLFKFI